MWCYVWILPRVCTYLTLAIFMGKYILNLCYIIVSVAVLYFVSTMLCILHRVLHVGRETSTCWLVFLVGTVHSCFIILFGIMYVFYIEWRVMDCIRSKKTLRKLASLQVLHEFHGVESVHNPLIQPGSLWMQYSVMRFLCNINLHIYHEQILLYINPYKNTI
jgi:hypothetical protein